MFQFYFNLLNLILFTGPILAVAAGRRWTHSGFHFFNAVLFLILMLLAPVPFNYGVHVTQILCTILKINLEALWVVVLLQAVELFPTVVRMSGLGLCHLVSQVCAYHCYINVQNVKQKKEDQSVTMNQTIFFSDHGLCCPLCYWHGKQWGHGMIFSLWKS